MNNSVFEILKPLGVFGSESRTKTLFKTGFYSIFNEFLRWILMKVSSMTWDYEKWVCINFRTN